MFPNQIQVLVYPLQVLMVKLRKENQQISNQEGGP